MPPTGWRACSIRWRPTISARSASSPSPRNSISERDFGSKRPIDDIRKSLDELLLQYDESTYVSKDYRESMDAAASRAADLAARGLPPEMDEWLETLGSDSVRRLSGQLLIDLLRNETVPGRMSETSRDMGAFVEELLLAGAYGECLPVIQELAAAIDRKPAIAPDACRRAIDSVGASSSLAEAAATLNEQTAEEFAAFEKLISAIGAVRADRGDGRLSARRRRHRHRARHRRDRPLGTAAIPAIAAALDDKRWFVQRELAKALGKIGSRRRGAAACRRCCGAPIRACMQAAVASLSTIADPAAERALHTVLKASTGEARAAVIASLVGLKDAARRADAGAHPARQRSVRGRAARCCSTR